MSVELIFGKSRTFRNTLEKVDLFSKSHWPILLLGETGVGKEVLARRIHFLSERRKGPFIPVNCGALPAGLFESELFGYERGAFSGAVQSQRGMVRAAQGGTLFLDEIGDLDLSLQVKLLRLLESNEIRSVGSTRVETVDVRIVAATNRSLKGLVQEGQFRQDLLERLSVLPVEIPALRNRSEDISLLATCFLERLGSSFSPADLTCLGNFEWPGNIRQLKNLMIRAHVLGSGKVEAKLLDSLLLSEKSSYPLQTPVENNLQGITLADIEKQIIMERLKRWHGNRKKAAKDLGIAKSTLHEKLRKWKVDSPSQAWPLFREPDAHPVLAQSQ